MAMIVAARPPRSDPALDSDFVGVNWSISEVPEPTSIVLFGLGPVGLFFTAYEHAHPERRRDRETTEDQLHAAGSNDRLSVRQGFVVTA